MVSGRARPRWRARPGELAAIARFGVVGIGATLVYLGVSLFLLDRGLAPHPTNLVAFVISIVASYLGHYFFTYRSDANHLRMGSRFVMVTAGLMALSAALHHTALLFGATPQVAALFVTVAYPPLSFALNHFWAFGRGTSGASR
jgi:putative flippase GtrA